MYRKLTIQKEECTCIHKGEEGVCEERKCIRVCFVCNTRLLAHKNVRDIVLCKCVYNVLDREERCACSVCVFTDSIRKE